MISRDRIEASLRHSHRDAGAYAVMMGAGETYLSAFALFLRATPPQIGLLASLPPLIGSFTQVLSAWIGHRTGRRKALVLAGASLQAAAWLPIALLPLLVPSLAVPCLIASVVFYQCGAHFASPQWASLMGDLVPLKRRGQFFARRTRTVSLVTFLSLCAAGLLLNEFTDAGHTLAGFVTVFAIAMCARTVSVYQLSRMYDPGGHVAAMEVPVGQKWWKRLRKSNIMRFSLFFALMPFSVAFASPYFSVYMLRDLQFSYAEFMMNSGMSVIAQFLTLNQWGRISDVFGNRRILSVTCLVLPLLPLLWVFSDNFGYLLFVQALSGLAWAGFTLSTGNFLYDLTSREGRATCMAVHNILASTGLFCGALAGGYLAVRLPAGLEVGLVSVHWLSSLPLVFALSASARLLVVLLLLPKIREVRRVRPISLRRLVFRVTGMHALAGMVFDIVGARPRSGGDRGESGAPQDRGDISSGGSNQV